MSTITDDLTDVRRADRRATLAPSISAARRASDAAQGARAGARDMLPMALSVGPLALVLGVAIDTSVVNDLAGIVAAPLIYAGAANFAALSVVDAGGSAFTAVVTALIVNVRFLMYGAAIAPRFRGQPDWFRWLAPWTIVDQTFALVSTGENRGSTWFRSYWLAASALLGAFYTGMVAVGVVLGPVVPAGIGLDLTIPALFVAMLAGRVRDRPALAAVVVGGLVTALTLDLPHGLALPLGAVAGASAAVLTRRTS
ncbi:MAG TPA: AzlC family ABC transporter permease [Euzebyales bacterium]|nr:AzlC family ABC transporter permease [Euzebyales bacterium]